MTRWKGRLNDTMVVSLGGVLLHLHLYIHTTIYILLIYTNKKIVTMG